MGESGRALARLGAGDGPNLMVPVCTGGENSQETVRAASPLPVDPTVFAKLIDRFRTPMRNFGQGFLVNALTHIALLNQVEIATLM